MRGKRVSIDELAAELPLRVPRPIGSWWTEDRRAYLMLTEDLVSSGCAFPDFARGGKVGFLDWACVSRGPGLRDVAYLLCSSADTDLRRAQEEALLRRYLEVLADSGAPAQAFADAWRDYRGLVAAAWVASVASYALGARLQSLEVGRRAVARANATLADLGTPALLRGAVA